MSSKHASKHYARDNEQSRAECVCGTQGSCCSPSNISGKPVRSSTFFTATPADSMALALPPVDTSSYPAAARPCVVGWLKHQVSRETGADLGMDADQGMPNKAFRRPIADWPNT